MENDLKKLGELIKEVRIAMLTTADRDGSLRSRPMATQREEFDGTLWFFTRASSPKVEEVEERQQVNLSYAAPDSNTYVSISGTARLVRDAAKAKQLWNPILKAWFPKGLDDPDLALLHVDVEKAEYWDSPSNAMVHIVGFVKAIATGHAYQPSEEEHQKITVS